MVKKLLENIKANTISGVLTWVVTGLISLLCLGILYSFSQSKKVNETYETQKELVKAVDLIVDKLDEKVDRKEYEKDILVYQSIQDSSVLILNNMRLSNEAFYNEVKTVMETERYYNERILQYLKDNK